MTIKKAKDSAIFTAVVQRHYKSTQRTRVYVIGRKQPAWLPDAERVGGFEGPLRPGARLLVRLQPTSGGEDIVSEIDYLYQLLSEMAERADQGCIRPMACADVVKYLECYGDGDEAIRVSINGNELGWPELPASVQFVVPKRLMPGETDGHKLRCLTMTLHDGYARVALHGVKRASGALTVELTMDF